MSQTLTCPAPLGDDIDTPATPAPPEAVDVPSRASPISQPQPRKRNVIVKNLPQEMDDEALTKAFEHIGVIMSARVMRNTHTGHSQGFGFVLFETPEAAQLACTTPVLYRRDGHSPPLLLVVDLANHNGENVVMPNRRKVYIGNVPCGVSLEQVREACEHIAPVESVTAQRGRPTKVMAGPAQFAVTPAEAAPADDVGGVAEGKCGLGERPLLDEIDELLATHRTIRSLNSTERSPNSSDLELEAALAFDQLAPSSLRWGLQKAETPSTATAMSTTATIAAETFVVFVQFATAAGATLAVRKLHNTQPFAVFFPESMQSSPPPLMVKLSETRELRQLRHGYQNQVPTPHSYSVSSHHSGPSHYVPPTAPYAYHVMPHSDRSGGFTPHAHAASHSRAAPSYYPPTPMAISPWGAPMFVLPIAPDGGGMPLMATYPFVGHPMVMPLVSPQGSPLPFQHR